MLGINKYTLKTHFYSQSEQLCYSNVLLGHPFWIMHYINAVKEVIEDMNKQNLI